MEIDEIYEKFANKSEDEIFDYFFNEKFAQVYQITYVETGSEEIANRKSIEESEEYAEFMMEKIKDGISET